MMSIRHDEHVASCLGNNELGKQGIMSIKHIQRGNNEHAAYWKCCIMGIKNNGLRACSATNQDNEQWM